MGIFEEKRSIVIQMIVYVVWIEKEWMLINSVELLLLIDVNKIRLKKMSITFFKLTSKPKFVSFVQLTKTTLVFVAEINKWTDVLVLLLIYVYMYVDKKERKMFFKWFKRRKKK